MSTPTIALMYDFDKTLCTKDMQEYTFISDVGMDAESFWKQTSDLAKRKKMDPILSYMYLMLESSRNARKTIRRERFVELGKDLQLFPGVSTWFKRINEIGRTYKVDIKHYIISSGLHEIIEGSSIYKEFDQVYACEFLYNENDVAVWPKNVVNYTTKTQFLFRINKGILDISDDESLNKYVKEDDRPVPFRNMIYIGDGLTDVPCMKLVKSNGGYSIAVYGENRKNKVRDLVRDNRVNFILPADYSKGSKLETTMKDIIEKMSCSDRLIRKSNEQCTDLT